MIGTKSSLFLFSILLLLLNSSLTTSAHEQHHHHHGNSAMDFLNSMAGTQRGDSIEGLSKLKKHLSNLGYIENDINLESSSSSSLSSPPIHDDLFDETLEEAVVKYQSFFNLPPTGILDAVTLAHMQKPRCGFRDVFHRRNTSAKYAFFGPNWVWPKNKRVLTYSFPLGMRKDVIHAVGEAAKMWGAVSAFTFRYTADFGKADIKVTFERGDHGDGIPFEGRGGVLAHAFAPPDGRLHFDADELWMNGAVNGSSKFDLQTLALHELGHNLGLQHSTDAGAIMFPTFLPGVRKGLGEDDKKGIRRLYVY